MTLVLGPLKLRNKVLYQKPLVKAHTHSWKERWHEVKLFIKENGVLPQKMNYNGTSLLSHGA
jgi:trehalose/maltose hydrolase-like predicted phosphorylase